jgi:hypothetical protein
MTDLEKVINTSDAVFTAALRSSTTGSLLVPVPSTVGTTGTGESLPKEQQFSERHAPTVVIVVRATPDAHENVAALLARYRGDDPKAGIEPEPDAKKK